MFVSGNAFCVLFVLCAVGLALAADGRQDQLATVTASAVQGARKMSNLMANRPEHVLISSASREENRRRRRRKRRRVKNRRKCGDSSCIKECKNKCSLSFGKFNDACCGAGSPCYDNPPDACRKSPSYDPCSSTPCAPNAACRNTQSSYTCTCNGGYIGDGITCTDINECDWRPSPCPGAHQCRNTPGGYDCVAVPSPCDPNPCVRGACTDDVGPRGGSTFTCSCPEGWTGVTCDDRDDYSTDIHSGINKGPGFADIGTSCAMGWTGPSCETDIDECATGMDDCNRANGEICVNHDGGFTCSPVGICTNTPTPCLTDSDCGTCLGGANAGGKCSSTADCPPKKTCRGGINDGDLCTVATTDCPASPSSCSSSSNNSGTICSVDSDCGDRCPTGTCENGSQPGKCCRIDSDCPNGWKGPKWRRTGTCTGSPDVGTCAPGSSPAGGSCIVDTPGACDTGSGICVIPSSPCSADDNAPCQNGGTCSNDSRGNAVCDCSSAAGYYGTYCEESISTLSVATGDVVVLAFLAFGDTPYDEDALTCIVDGARTSGSTCSKCGTSNRRRRRLYAPTTSDDACAYNGARFDCAEGCTYEGRDYSCWKNDIIPYIADGTTHPNHPYYNWAAFSVHVGDIFKGKASGDSGRCNPDSFASRRDLFAGIPNCLLVPGDNDWEECNGFSSIDNSNVIKTMWRDNFADTSSPFNTFSRPFPLVDTSYAAGSNPPTLHRQANAADSPLNYPENYFFVINDVALFGLNIPAGWYPPGNVNEDWITDSLNNAHVTHNFVFSGVADTCRSIQSVVIVSHVGYPSSVASRINGPSPIGFFPTNCNGKTVPILNIAGNTHPTQFQLTKSGNDEYRLTVEAFRSGPLLVKVLKGPITGDHSFMVEDSQATVDSNYNCPNFPDFTL